MSDTVTIPRKLADNLHALVCAMAQARRVAASMQVYDPNTGMLETYVGWQKELAAALGIPAPDAN